MLRQREIPAPGYDEEGTYTASKRCNRGEQGGYHTFFSPAGFSSSFCSCLRVIGDLVAMHVIGGCQASYRCEEEGGDIKLVRGTGMSVLGRARCV